VSGRSVLESSSIDNSAGFTGPEGIALSIDHCNGYKPGSVPAFSLTGPLLKLRVTGLSETGRADGAAGPSFVDPERISVSRGKNKE
jgi:hypothetical protein